MKFLFLFCFSFFSITGFSQNINLSDAEYQRLHDKARLLINSNKDSSFIYASKIEKSDNNLHKSFAYGIKSYLFQLKGDSVTSKQLYKKSLIYLDKVPNSIEKTKHHSYLLSYGGLAEWKRGHLSKALEYYQQGQKLSRKVDDFMQVVKFNNNIAIVNKEIGNLKLSIQASKESDRITDKIEYLYDVDKFYQAKSQINLNLGNCYKDLFLFNQNRKIYLDSAIYYYNKTVIFSEYIKGTKLNAEINIALAYLLKRDINKAEKNYKKLLVETKDLGYENCLVNYGLGRVYYQQKKYDEALLCFKKVDSIYQNTKMNIVEFVHSNYFQAKIYAANKDYDSALKYSKLYLSNFKEHRSELNEETLKVNALISTDNLEKEMVTLKEDLRNERILRYMLVFLTIVIVLFFFIKNYINKNKANKKVKLLIEEFRKREIEDVEKENHTLIDNNSGRNDLSNNSSILILDETKEKEIVEKLKILEEKLEYLKEGYTLQYVAKKIKTNTTYLSYVINKNFEKTFSEYTNELKINYVISQMIANPIYRKYSTQAIAESVGFKNASSFTKSFSKRTGVTPVQFAKNIDS
ncbi:MULTISPECIES: helix-turn-helix domain-containing protein [unclassified Flavobacterium]|uniref:helix-turn-helix domain-containing protein n=1 Tax=unclassified Flavobacterium TaxID=196869 RepID=UPI003607F456